MFKEKPGLFIYLFIFYFFKPFPFPFAYTSPSVPYKASKSIT